jgi:GDP-D-mannose dehydratase
MPKSRTEIRFGQAQIRQALRGWEVFNTLINNTIQGKESSLEKAIIIGAGGQDGSLLLEKILSFGGMVYAVVGQNGLKINKDNTVLIRNHIESKKLVIIDGSFNGHDEITKIIKNQEIDKVFHLASVESSSKYENRFNNREIQLNLNLELTKKIINSMHQIKSSAKYIFAASSRMFEGYAGYLEVEENTLPKVIDNYGHAKLETMNYLNREKKENNIDANTVILFNHDSDRRKSNYLIWDIVNQFKRILDQSQNFINLRNPHKTIDISNANDIVDAIYKVSKLQSNSDYVIGQGRGEKISELCLNLVKQFEIRREIQILDQNKELSRNTLISNIGRIKNDTGWIPKKTYQETIYEMIRS